MDKKVRSALIKSLRLRRKQLEENPYRFPQDVSRCFVCRVMSRRWGWNPRGRQALFSFIHNECSLAHSDPKLGRKCPAREYCQEYIYDVKDAYEFGNSSKVLAAIDDMLERLNADK